jgi:hypothetical protein
MMPKMQNVGIADLLQRYQLLHKGLLNYVSGEYTHNSQKWLLVIGPQVNIWQHTVARPDNDGMLRGRAHRIKQEWYNRL